MDYDVSEEEILLILQEVMTACVKFFGVICLYFLNRNRISHSTRDRIRRRYSLIARIPDRMKYLHTVTMVSDEDCITHIRMNRSSFARLCFLLESSGGLKGGRNSNIPEQVAMFLSILAHHTKNRIVKTSFKWSTRTVSRHFHKVLNAVIRLHPLLLAQPIPIDENCTDPRWKCFKGCLGALDGTYIPVKVEKAHRGRYRNRKGEVSVNVLAACDRKLNYTYVLSGWEGSAADSRVLQDAVNRPNGLKIPRGSFYLCDNGYTNGEGFLAPYRGIRYHLDDWGQGRRRPQNKEEYYNMKHTRARNVIERSFGILKMRWAILKSASYYPIKVQNRIIMACCLLHNFIRTTMPYDPVEAEVPETMGQLDEGDYVDVVESTPQWRDWRDDLVTQMYNEWGG